MTGYLSVCLVLCLSNHKEKTITHIYYGSVSDHEHRLVPADLQRNTISSSSSIFKDTIFATKIHHSYSMLQWLVQIKIHVRCCIFSILALLAYDDGLGTESPVLDDKQLVHRNNHLASCTAICLSIAGLIECSSRQFDNMDLADSD